LRAFGFERPLSGVGNLLSKASFRNSHTLASGDHALARGVLAAASALLSATRNK